MNRTLRKRIEMQKKRAVEKGIRMAEADQRVGHQEYLKRAKASEIYNKGLREQGKLGVAISMDVLMANINEMVENSDKYFLRESLDEVLKNPSLAGDYYNMAYLPESGKELLEVTIYGVDSIGSLEEMEQRAQRNIAYKILRKKATHGVNYKMEWNLDTITLRAIPIILTRSL